MAGATAHGLDSLRGRQPRRLREQDGRTPGRTLDDRTTGAGIRPGLSLSLPVWRAGELSGAGAGMGCRSLDEPGRGGPPGDRGRGPGRGRGETPKNPEVRPGPDTPPRKKNPFPQRGSQRHMGGEPKTDIYLTFPLPSEQTHECWYIGVRGLSKRGRPLFIYTLWVRTRSKPLFVSKIDTGCVGFV